MVFSDKISAIIEYNPRQHRSPINLGTLNFTMATILKEKTVFEDKLVIERGELKAFGKNFYRFRLKQENAVAVLIINTDTNKVILTSQFRYAIASKAEEQILEIVAGKLEEGEEPLKAALREVEEETGYKIQSENIKILLSCFSSPGYSSERFIIYYATVSSADKVSKGGGLEHENEYIEVVEMDLSEFNENIKQAKFQDAKTYIAGMYLTLKNNN